MTTEPPGERDPQPNTRRGADLPREEQPLTPDPSEFGTDRPAAVTGRDEPGGIDNPAPGEPIRDREARDTRPPGAEETRAREWGGDADSDPTDEETTKEPADVVPEDTDADGDLEDEDNLEETEAPPDEEPV